MPISIHIVCDDEYEKNEDFYIELGEPRWIKEEGDEEANADDGGRPVLGDHPRCKVVITEDREFKNFVDRLLVNANTSMMVGTSSWKQQFVEAITLQTDEDEEGGEPATPSLTDKILHYVAVPWKVLFACIPPTDYYKGWICFVVSIFMIGLLTAVIGDLAAHFGCTCHVKDSVTAVTLVAMGTSIPDTFASRTAAVADPTADSSIGNVTGSNAVNVFLGIGIAWAIAAIHHAWKGTEFRVHAGNLAFSVTLFLIGSVLCIGMLQYRRRIGGELGGATSCKWVSALLFVSIWIAYITLAALEAYCIIPGF